MWIKCQITKSGRFGTIQDQIIIMSVSQFCRILGLARPPQRLLATNKPILSCTSVPRFYAKKVSRWRFLWFFFRCLATFPFIYGTPKRIEIQKKHAVVCNPYFLIRHTPGITKITKWKYFMFILARNFDISVLCTKKWHEFDRKRGIFSIWLTFLAVNELKIWN